MDGLNIAVGVYGKKLRVKKKPPAAAREAMKSLIQIGQTDGLSKSDTMTAYGIDVLMCWVKPGNPFAQTAYQRIQSLIGDTRHLVIPPNDSDTDQDG